MRIDIKGIIRKRQMKVSTSEEYGKRHKFEHISAIIKKIEILCSRYIYLIVWDGQNNHLTLLYLHSKYREAMEAGIVVVRPMS